LAATAREVLEIHMHL